MFWAPSRTINSFSVIFNYPTPLPKQLHTYGIRRALSSIGAIIIFVIHYCWQKVIRKYAAQSPIKGIMTLLCCWQFKKCP